MKNDVLTRVNKNLGLHQKNTKDQTHYNLDKEEPSGHPVMKRKSDEDKVIALSNVGGLHQKYILKKFTRIGRS